MCEPTLWVMGAGVAMNAIGARNEAGATKDAAKYNAGVYSNLAADARTRGEEEVVRQRMATKALKGKQIATLAANGIDVNQGSALDILASTDILSFADEETIRRNAEREAYGYQTQASLSSATARSINPNTAGFTALLTGAGQVASTWYSMKSAGVGGSSAPSGSPYNKVGAYGNWYGTGPAQGGR